MSLGLIGRKLGMTRVFDQEAGSMIPVTVIDVAGNEFVHFTIRGIEAAQSAKAQGFDVASLLEHPEDLGRTTRGEPASIWQLSDIRTVFGKARFTTVAGHQCQYPDTDRKKPTRLLSDLDDIGDFGVIGWPKFDAGGWYVGPLPHDCRHDHREKVIGRNAKGGFHTAPTAAYPPGMCKFLAERIFRHFSRGLTSDRPSGGGEPLRAFDRELLLLLCRLLPRWHVVHLLALPLPRKRPRLPRRNLRFCTDMRCRLLRRLASGS